MLKYVKDFTKLRMII